MKKLALLFVALIGTTVLVAAAPLQTKTTEQTTQTKKEVVNTMPAKHKKNHKIRKEVKKTEISKSEAAKPDMKK